MTRFTIILLTLFCLTSQAYGYQYYYYDKKKINLNDRTYARYIRPQLRAIVHDFYYVLKKMDPFEEHLIALKKEVLSVSKKWRETQVACSENLEKCQAKIKATYKQSKRVDAQLLKFRAPDKLVTIAGQKKLLQMAHDFDQLITISYQIMGQLEHLLITHDGKGIEKTFIIGPNSFPELINRMLFHAEDIMIYYLDPPFRKEFETVWSDFIKIIEQRILPSKKQDPLLDNLGKLNLAWSGFHMKMERGNSNFPMKLHVNLSIIRSRWNSILKVYMKNTNFVDVDAQIKKQARK